MFGGEGEERRGGGGGGGGGARWYKGKLVEVVMRDSGHWRGKLRCISDFLVLQH